MTLRDRGHFADTGDMPFYHVFLVDKLKSVGFKFERHGGNHDIYRRGSDIENVPRHKEINEKLARAILKKWGI